MKKLTELVMILDRSGSMAGLERDTIGGFNALVQKQKKEEGEVLLSTILFDDRMEVLHDRVPLAGVKPITEDQYYVRGCTALLDAVGMTITRIRSSQEKMENPPEKTLVVITTDGLENASREYSFEAVRRLIEKQEKGGWEFLFLGANMDAVKEGGRFGIHPDHAAGYCCDSQGTALNYEVLSDAISGFRENDAPLAGCWKARIDEDHAKRGHRRK